ncbi:MAG: NADH-quinone oxidoreductase subunit J [Thermodesulfovibrionia bacterium]|nr:NADH-quinone oxidoreductase subunit J [Thermodesulfovibrionia bacterium]
MSLPKLFFIYFAIMLTVSSIFVVTRRNPVHSVVWMLILFVHIAGVYLFLNAEFLAAIQIIVYAGAILVLFLFVIMLLNLRPEEMGKKFLKQWPFGVIIGIVFIVFFTLILAEITVLPQLGKYSIERIQSVGTMMTIGTVLYTEYLFPFEIASLILLVAILGAVVLSKKKLE